MNSSRASSSGWLGTANGSRVMITFESVSPGTSTPCQKRIGAEDHAVDVGLEHLDHLRSRHAVALGIKGDLARGQPRAQDPRRRRRASCAR